MAYAKGRVFHDADSHIMELPNFLIDHADPAMRSRMPRIHVDAPRLREGLAEASERGAHSAETVAELVRLGDGLIAGPKGYQALGAFNAVERALALDHLGFSSQLVFASFSAGLTFSTDRPIDERYAAARAHNRAMADFCSVDKRLMGVALLPLDDVDLALAEIDHIIRLGLRAAWVPHRPCGGRSPGHNDLDPVWAMLADAKVPFMIHVGGGAMLVDPAWTNNGRPVPNDWLGGGENIRAKDMGALHHLAETFVSTLVLDGVFERHAGLKGAVVELGAGWAPSLMARLDLIAELWGRSEPELKAMRRKPSQQVLEHMAFTPYAYEDVGALIRQSDPSLYMFASDYPHVEGGRAPLARFAASLEGSSEAVQSAFYAGNFERLFS